MPVVAEVAIAAAVPVMIVLDPAAVALPVAFKEAAPVIAGPDPVGAGIRWASPVSAMPFVVVSHRIPVAFDPKVIRPRGSWPGVNDARRRWRPNSHTDR